MGQFVEVLDEKGRFCSLHYDMNAQDSPIARSYCFSTQRMNREHNSVYEHLRLLALAQDMAEDYGLECIVKKK